MTTLVTDPTLRATFTRSLDATTRQESAQDLRALGHDTSKSSVMQFQRDQHIKVDGIIGPQTHGALSTAMKERDRSGIDPSLRVEGERRAPTEADRRTVQPGTTPARDFQARDLSRVPPPNANERQKFDYYASIVRANGGTVNPGGKPSVLGIRARDGVTHNFEDKMVVLSPNGHVQEFSASTRPSNTTTQNGGVAELKPGNYDVNPHGPHYDRPSWQVFTKSGSGNVPVYRDLNGDGQYSASEKASPRTGDGILFHVPNPRYNDQIPTSIGCINIKNADFDRFMASVGGARQSFSFTLVDR